MKGVINKGIQEYAEANFGADVWETIKARARCEEFVFAPTQDYPDELTPRLIEAASAILNLPLETVQVEYGKFMVPNTLKETYPPYFALAGKSAWEFLHRLDEIHSHVTRHLENARPPRLQCKQLSARQLLIHYHSPRRLCSVLRGLILGVGICFGQDLSVRETACMRRGDQKCTFEVTLS